MFSIIYSNFDSPHLKQLAEWFTAEWGNTTHFSTSKNGLTIPSPLLAVDGSLLLGGLAFTRYVVPDGDRMGLWVNALLVAPEWRGAGIGAQLIQAAEIEATRINETELFALTDVPRLYRRSGWVDVRHDDVNTVVRKNLIQK